MKIRPLKIQRLKRSEFAEYECLTKKEIRELMRDNDGSETAKTLNDLTPAIELLYFIYQYRRRQEEGEV